MDSLRLPSNAQVGEDLIKQLELDDEAIVIFELTALTVEILLSILGVAYRMRLFTMQKAKPMRGIL